MAATASALRVVAPVARIAARKTSVSRAASVVKVIIFFLSLSSPFCKYIKRMQPNHCSGHHPIVHRDLAARSQRAAGAYRSCAHSLTSSSSYPLSPSPFEQPSKALRGSVKTFATESEVSDMLEDALKVRHCRKSPS